MKEQIGRYEIIREIGRGGMATVYLAKDAQFDNRLVAVKVLPRQFTHDPNFLALFAKEAKMIGKLEHSAIVPVHDYGEQDDVPYLVMRYMPGGSLRGRIEGRPLALEEIEPILDRVARALDYAHKHRIVHRDVKPANILFDDENAAYLADFGIAKMEESTRTFTGIVGTAAYMSPEQVQSKVKLDGRSDVYSLGVVLYEMFTGGQPFEADSDHGKMIAHLNDPVPDVLASNPGLPSAVKDIIEKALAKDREDRYATAGELAKDVSVLVGGYEEKVVARPEEKAALETAVPAAEEISTEMTAPTPAPQVEEAEAANPDNEAIKYYRETPFIVGGQKRVPRRDATEAGESAADPEQTQHDGVAKEFARMPPFAGKESKRTQRKDTTVTGERAEYTGSPAKTQTSRSQDPVAESSQPAAKKVGDDKEQADQMDARLLMLVIVEGTLLALVGLLLVTEPYGDHDPFIWLAAVYWLIAGIFSFIKIFIDRSLVLLYIMAGIAGLAAGYVLISSDQYLSNFAVLVLAFSGATIGIANLGLGAQLRDWGAGILGVISFIYMFLVISSLDGMSVDASIGVILAIAGGSLAAILAWRSKKAAAQRNPSV